MPHKQQVQGGQHTMTKYMKITTSEVYGQPESPFVDLYKINNIAEYSRPQNVEGIEILDDPRAFFTTFTAPGRRDGYRVNGTAKELITHIEKQQKRARKGLEVEPYEPKRKLYTENGKVHALNQSYKPNGTNWWIPSKTDT